MSATLSGMLIKFKAFECFTFAGDKSRAKSEHHHRTQTTNHS